MGINVLSTFDGIACGYQALSEAGIEVNKYFASEIDQHAINVSMKNFRDIIQIGDVSKVRFGPNIYNSNKNGLWFIQRDHYYHTPVKIDLVLGGSPCQSFSNVGDGTGFDGESKLFWEFVRVLTQAKKANPKVKFLFENVKMKKEWQDIITKALGVEPIIINSALVSAQHRERCYWTNIPGVTQPKDEKIFLKKILQKNFDQKYIHTEKAIAYMNRKVKGGRTHWDFAHHSDTKNKKSACVVSNFKKGVPYNVLVDGKTVRRFTPVECERLQGLPDKYTEGISDTRRYEAIGNGWNIDTIAYIFSFLKN